MFKKALLILFLLISKGFSQELIEISGKIIDTQGHPIAFTSVFIKNLTTSTMANQNSEYKINLPEGRQTIIFRFVGYKQHQIAFHVKPATKVNAVL